MHDTDTEERPPNPIFEFFQQQRKLAKAQKIKVSKNFEAKIQRVMNIESLFAGWLAGQPDKKVFDYYGACPITQFAQTLKQFEGKCIIGDTDRFIVKDDEYTFRFVPIPSKLGQIIHGCRREKGDGCTILARDLKDAIGII